MARQREVKLVGTLDNVIFYNRLGEYCMRTKPASVRRTPSSVHSGLNFGKASRVAKRIRSIIAQINPCKTDSRMINRLNGALNKFISWKEKKDLENKLMPDNLPWINEFQFNDQVDLSSFRAIQVSINSYEKGGNSLRLEHFTPNRELHVPSGTDHILFKGRLIRIDLENAGLELLLSLEIKIPNSNEIYQSTPIPITAEIKPGSLIMMILSIQYMVNKNGEIEMLDDLKKLPCGIAYARIF